MTTCSCVFSANRRGEWRGNDSHLSLTVKVSLDRGERGAAEQSAGSDGRLTLFHSHSLLSPLLSSPLCASKVNDPREEREKGKGKKRGSTAVLCCCCCCCYYLQRSIAKVTLSLTRRLLSLCILSLHFGKRRRRRSARWQLTHTHTHKKKCHPSLRALTYCY